MFLPLTHSLDKRSGDDASRPEGGDRPHADFAEQ